MDHSNNQEKSQNNYSYGMKKRFGRAVSTSSNSSAASSTNTSFTATTTSNTISSSSTSSHSATSNGLQNGLLQNIPELTVSESNNNNKSNSTKKNDKNKNNKNSNKNKNQKNNEYSSSNDSDEYSLATPTTSQNIDHVDPDLPKNDDINDSYTVDYTENIGTSYQDGNINLNDAFDLKNIKNSDTDNNANNPNNSGKETPKNLGSYRNRAGKFSNTLSNLLPNISAKLHHSKKNNKTPTTSNTPVENTSSKSFFKNNKTTNSKSNNNIFNGLGSSVGNRSGTPNNIASDLESENSPSVTPKIILNNSANGSGNSSSLNAYGASSSSSKEQHSIGSYLAQENIPPNDMNVSNIYEQDGLLGEGTYMRNVTPPDYNQLHPSTSASYQPIAIPFPRKSLESPSISFDPHQNEKLTNYHSDINNNSSASAINNNNHSSHKSTNNKESNNVLATPQITRTRNNTINSQITSISGNYSNNIWSSNPQPFPTKMGANNNATNTGNHNAIQTQSSSNNWRSRSKSNASSLYMDSNQHYDQISMVDSASGYFNSYNLAGNANIGNNVSGNDSLSSQQLAMLMNIPPVVGDDIDPRSLNWVTTDITAPAINHVPNIPPTNTITISNIFSLQKQQTETVFSNAINLTSSSVATLCLSFGPVISARTLSGLNLALVEFQHVESAVRAMEALNNQEISMVGIPSMVSFAKIIPVNVRSNSLTAASQINKNSNPQPARSLLQDQLLNGSLSFQQNGSISIPMFNTNYAQSVVTDASSQSILQVPSSTMPAQNFGRGYSFSSISTTNNNNNNTVNGNNGHPISNNNKQNSSSGNNNNGYHSNSHNNSSSHNGSSVVEKEVCPFVLPPPDLSSKVDELNNVIEKLVENEATYHNNNSIDREQIKHLIDKSLNYKGTRQTNNFGPLPEPLSSKVFDSPTLRELRKMLDSDSLTDLEIEQLSLCMLDELPELCSDYLGNTIVQKLFQTSDELIRDIMLRKTNKYLTSMGVHKNGTWVCQKMVSMSSNKSSNKSLVVNGIENFCTPLFNDQFGNYVIQCCLKFGFPWNSFIFESIIANFWTICQSRYGARAVRACLEATDIITKEQLIVLSAMIVVYSDYLSTNTNGTLLLTWYLDTCTLAHKHEVLTPKLIDHIVELSCHKLASLTILKVLNHRNEFKAKKQILEAIFGDLQNTIKSKRVSQRSASLDNDPESESFQQGKPDYGKLMAILSDCNNGPTFVYKVLSLSLLDSHVRQFAIDQVKALLLENDSHHSTTISNAKSHRKLMEEIGLGNTIPDTSDNNSPTSQAVTATGTNSNIMHTQPQTISEIFLNIPLPTSQMPTMINSSGQPITHVQAPSLSHIFGSSSQTDTLLGTEQTSSGALHLSSGQHLRNLSVGSVLSSKSTRSRGFSSGAHTMPPVSTNLNSNGSANPNNNNVMPGGFYNFTPVSTYGNSNTMSSGTGANNDYTTLNSSSNNDLITQLELLSTQGGNGYNANNIGAPGTTNLGDNSTFNVFDNKNSNTYYN